jgi:hypothetical protein
MECDARNAGSLQKANSMTGCFGSLSFLGLRFGLKTFDMVGKARWSVECLMRRSGWVL